MKGAEARGHRTPDGFVVLQGSTAVLQERQSAKRWPYVIALRKELIDDGTLIQKDGLYLFTRDAEFSSPSAAAAVIEGGSANGLIDWSQGWKSPQRTRRTGLTIHCRWRPKTTVTERLSV